MTPYERLASVNRAIDDLTLLRSSIEREIASQPAPATPVIDQLRARCETEGFDLLNGRLVSESDAAELLGRAVKTLRNARYDENNTMTYEKFGGRVYYDIEIIARNFE